MKIYKEDKKTLIENPNRELGKLISDKIHVHRDELPYIPDEGHYEVLKEYPNGGKELIFVIDKPGQIYTPAEDYDEEIQVYIPYTKEELEQIELSKLRERRETECFAICDRAVWYDNLTDTQKQDIKLWRQSWCEVTKTKTIPEKPEWLKI